MKLLSVIVLSQEQLFEASLVIFGEAFEDFLNFLCLFANGHQAIKDDIEILLVRNFHEILTLDLEFQVLFDGSYMLNLFLSEDFFSTLRVTKIERYFHKVK